MEIGPQIPILSGISKGYVSQLLNGHFDHKLSKMMEPMQPIGMMPSFELVLIEEAVESAKKGKALNDKPRKSAKRKQPSDRAEGASSKELVKV